MAYRQSKDAKGIAKLTLGGLIEQPSISVPEDAQGRRLRSTIALLREILSTRCVLALPLERRSVLVENLKMP